MIQHVVLITFTPEATDRQKQELVDGLEALPGLIPEIVSYHVGIDLGLAEGNAGVGVVAQFGSEQGWATYRDHPEHRRVIDDLIAPIRASRSAIQFAL